MKLGIIVNSHHIEALRFANSALRKGDKVNFFAVGGGLFSIIAMANLFINRDDGGHDELRIESRYGNFSWDSRELEREENSKDTEGLGMLQWKYFIDQGGELYFEKEDFDKDWEGRTHYLDKEEISAKLLAIGYTIHIDQMYQKLTECDKVFTF